MISDQDGEVTIDDQIVTATLPFVSEHTHVKKATSEFIAVSGFGFHVLWNGVSTLYITLEPFFINKV